MFFLQSDTGNLVCGRWFLHSVRGFHGARGDQGIWPDPSRLDFFACAVSVDRWGLCHLVGPMPDAADAETLHTAIEIGARINDAKKNFII